MFPKGLIQQVWKAQSLHVPKKGLALHWFLGRNLYALGISFPIRLALHTWDLGTHQIVYANKEIYYECLFLFSWALRSCYINLTPRGEGRQVETEYMLHAYMTDTQ